MYVKHLVQHLAHSVSSIVTVIIIIAITWPGFDLSAVTASLVYEPLLVT